MTESGGELSLQGAAETAPRGRVTRSRRAVAHAAPETPDPSPEPAAGSDMGTMSNEERERRILAMEEELRLLKGQSPQSSNFSRVCTLVHPGWGSQLGWN